MTSSVPTPQERLQAVFDQLSPELQRAARWVSSNPAKVGLWSMRRQAQELSLAPATMLRLARAAGYSSYDSFRAPFQRALAAGEPSSLRQRAAQLQGEDGRSLGAVHDVLSGLQIQAVRSASALNTAGCFEAAARAMLQARLVGFVGVRSSFGTACQMYYAYQLIRHNGVLLASASGVMAEQADVLGPGDVLVAVAQSPYAMATMQVVRHAHAAGATVVALTDDAAAPMVRYAQHVLLCQADHQPGNRQARTPGSFLHTMAGPLALAENLIACLAAHGGQAVLDRLEHVEGRMREQQIYWVQTDAPIFNREIPKEHDDA